MDTQGDSWSRASNNSGLARIALYLVCRAEHGTTNLEKTVRNLSFMLSSLALMAGLGILSQPLKAG